MQTVYTLLFCNDGNEWENYGVFATRNAAQAAIHKMQQEYGEDVFATEQFSIEEMQVQAQS